jgi:chlorite dismutase
VEYAPPELDSPYRVLILVAATEGWFAAPQEERESALDDFAGLLGGMEAEGARLLASFDDDLFLTGQPAPLPYTIFLLYDVDDLAAVVRLVHRLRSSDLSRFLRLEARIGRRLFVLER